MEEPSETPDVWDISSSEFGTSLLGFGEFAQSRALEFLADEIRRSGYTLSHQSADLFRSDNTLGVSNITSHWLSELPHHRDELGSVQELAAEYMDWVRWPVGAEPLTLEIPAEIADLEYEREYYINWDKRYCLIIFELIIILQISIVQSKQRKKRIISR